MEALINARNAYAEALAEYCLDVSRIDALGAELLGKDYDRAASIGIIIRTDVQVAQLATYNAFSDALAR